MFSNLLPVLVAEPFNSVSHLRVWTEIDYYFHFSVSLEAFFQEMNPQTSFILVFFFKKKNFLVIFYLTGCRF